MIDTIEALIYSIKHWGPIERHRNRHLDRERDRIIEGKIFGRKVKSDLIDVEAIGESQVRDAYYMTYPEAVREVERLVEASNRSGNREIRLNRVENVDTGADTFETANGPQPKFTLQMGNNRDPEFNILFLTGVHGEESRLWRAGLEAALQLARPGELRDRLLKRGQITFDLFNDIHGMDNQSRGFVARDGVQVNDPLIFGRAHDSNPFGLGDRNSEQGRNSPEAQSVLTRSNHAHYRRVCGPLTWIGDHHETNENSQYPSDFFRYGGIMHMAHIYLTDLELHQLNQLRRCLTVTDRVRKFINDWSPLSEPKFREQIIYNHPTLRKLRRIRDRVRELGQRTFEDIYEQAILLFPYVERDFSLDESIWIGGEMFRVPGILLGPDVLAPEGMTSESLQQDLVVRLRQTLATMEAQLMVVGLDYKGGDGR
ncbi:MAG: hypothetical protein ACUVXI_16710 [bacterium]